VLLDEPSSSLDRHAETELKNTLIEIAKTRTVIMVSHSPTLLSACDYLYALDRGKLALAGPAREVLPRLFGGKAPPPKDDGPAPGKPPTTPKGGPGPKKPTGGDKGLPGGLSAKSQPQTPIEPSAQPSPTSPLQNLVGNGAAPVASSQARPQAKATKPQVKAAATPRGKAPSMARAQNLAKTVQPKAQARAVQKPKAAPRSIPSLRARQEASAVSLEGVKPAAGATLRTPASANKTMAKATPHVRPAAPKTNASVQLRGKERPHKRSTTAQPSVQAASKSPMSDASAATPTIRGPRLVRSLPNSDTPPSPKKEASKPHPNIKAGATLRPTTQSILKDWAEGKASLSSSRSDLKGRGAGARARSTPNLRSKGSAGE